MILPEDMLHVAARFAAAGLTERYVETADPDVEDDHVEIFRGGTDTRVTIQISLLGGGYYVNEYRGEDTSLVMIPRGNYSSFRKAVDRAIEVVNIKLSSLSTQKEP